jgi:excisionase family DNA binding protein
VPFSISTGAPAPTSVSSRSRESSEPAGTCIEARTFDALGRQQGAEAPIVVTITEATRLLSVGRTTLYKLMNEGHLTAVKIGGASRVLRTSLDEFVQRAKV